MTRTLRRVLGDDSGQGLVEYGLILFFVAVVCIAALTALGVNIQALLTSIAGDI